LHHGIELRLVHGLAAILREKKIDNILRTGQAAYMRGKNAIRAGFHIESRISRWHEMPTAAGCAGRKKKKAAEAAHLFRREM
jgi:hypothetical protein